jgi:hypothetical protein
MNESSFYKRVTKYNPLFRNEQGHYLRDEWISVSDVGKEFAGQRLHLDEYLAVEARYIQAVQIFFSGSAHVVVESVEAHSTGKVDEALRDVYRQVKKGMRSFPNSDLGALVTLALRELMWYRLVDDTGTKAVEFGYDYYMYLGFEVPDPECFRRIEELALFVE